MQRLSSIYVALLISVFVLAFPPNGYMGMDEFRYGLFLLICGGYSVAVIVIRAQLALTGIHPIRKPAKHSGRLGLLSKAAGEAPIAAKLILLFMLFTVLSAALSDYPRTFIGAFRKEGVLTIAIYALSCIFLSKLFRPGKWMLFLLGASTVAFCIIPFIQLTGANPFSLYPAGYNYYDAGVYYPGRYLGAIGNVGLVAAFLSIAIGLFAMAIIKLDFKERWLLAIPLFLAVFLMFAMAVDAGIAALAAGLTIMLPVAVTNHISLSRTLFVFAIILAAYAMSGAVVFGDGRVSLSSARLMYLIATGLAAVAAAIVPACKPFAKIPAKWYKTGSVAAAVLIILAAALYLRLYSGESSGMVYEASEILRGRWDDSFGTRRVYIWRNVLGGVGGNLLLGTGPDTLGYWAIEPFTRYSEELGTTLTTRIDAAHNEYLHILACVGLLPLLCYLGAIASTIFKWFRTSENKLSAIAGAGTLFYSIQAFFGISMFITAPLFWAVLAVLIYSQNTRKER